MRTAARDVRSCASSRWPSRWPSAVPGDGRLRPPRPPTTTCLRVLLFYKANFHASHVQARQAVRDLATELATEYGQTLEIQETDDPAAFTPENLATNDALVFAQTGGVLFNTAQRAALEAYIRGGGGFVGHPLHRLVASTRPSTT